MNTLRTYWKKNKENLIWALLSTPFATIGFLLFLGAFEVINNFVYRIQYAGLYWLLPIAGFIIALTIKRVMDKYSLTKRV